MSFAIFVVGGEFAIFPLFHGFTKLTDLAVIGVYCKARATCIPTTRLTATGNFVFLGRSHSFLSGCRKETAKQTLLELMQGALSIKAQNL